ncbi:MAG TPA: cyclopropane-fatty-acyl-phospholipid synthase family protein [Ramlibacter sp.]
MTATPDLQLAAARRLLQHVATRLEADLSARLWDGSIVPLGPGARSDILISVNSPRVVRRLLFKPQLMTVFELYAEGEIGIDGGTPLQAVRRWDHLKAVRLASKLDKRLLLQSLWPFLRSGGGRSAAEAAAFHGQIPARRDEGRDDQALIRFHYDVSNAFYALFLDAEMVYSPGHFERPDMTLDEAAVTKLDTICRRLRLHEGDRLLDIGCGWGGLVCHAARHFGVKAVGVTLSQEQHDFARDKVRRLGLEDRVTIELRDFRTLEGDESFDAISQVGMFEHLGIDNHDTYFALVHRLLKPRGRYLHDAITRRASWVLSEFRTPTAYQKVLGKFIFPGGELDYIGMTLANLERHGFEVHSVRALREHYQRSVELWSERLAANEAAAVAEVGAARTRLWQLYFCLSALAFERNLAFDFQTVATKRRAGASGMM